MKNKPSINLVNRLKFRYTCTAEFPDSSFHDSCDHQKKEPPFSETKPVTPPQIQVHLYSCRADISQAGGGVLLVGQRHFPCSLFLTFCIGCPVIWRSASSGKGCISIANNVIFLGSKQTLFQQKTYFLSFKKQVLLLGTCTYRGHVLVSGGFNGTKRGKNPHHECPNPELCATTSYSPVPYSPDTPLPK